MELAVTENDQIVFKYNINDHLLIMNRFKQESNKFTLSLKSIMLFSITIANNNVTVVDDINICVFCLNLIIQYIISRLIANCITTQM